MRATAIADNTGLNMPRIDDTIRQQFEDLIKEGGELIALAKTARSCLLGDQIAKNSFLGFPKWPDHKGSLRREERIF